MRRNRYNLPERPEPGNCRNCEREIAEYIENDLCERCFEAKKLYEYHLKAKREAKRDRRSIHTKKMEKYQTILERFRK